MSNTRMLIITAARAILIGFLLAFCADAWNIPLFSRGYWIFISVGSIVGNILVRIGFPYEQSSNS